MAPNCALPSSQLCVIQFTLSPRADDAQLPITHDAALISSIDSADRSPPRAAKRSSTSRHATPFKTTACQAPLCADKLAKHCHAARFNSNLGLPAAKISSVGSAAISAQYSWNWLLSSGKALRAAKGQSW